jgi:hypothetical protein
MPKEGIGQRMYKNSPNLATQHIRNGLIWFLLLFSPSTVVTMYYNNNKAKYYDKGNLLHRGGTRARDLLIQQPLWHAVCKVSIWSWNPKSCTTPSRFGLTKSGTWFESRSVWLRPRLWHLSKKQILKYFNWLLCCCSVSTEKTAKILPTLRSMYV